jgi:hypothetical protein
MTDTAARAQRADAMNEEFYRASDEKRHALRVEAMELARRALWLPLPLTDLEAIAVEALIDKLGETIGIALIEGYERGYQAATSRNDDTES